MLTDICCNFCTILILWALHNELCVPLLDQTLCVHKMWSIFKPFTKALQTMLSRHATAVLIWELELMEEGFEYLSLRIHSL